MQFINIVYEASLTEVLKTLRDNEFVNHGVRFEEGRGVPHMRIKERKNGKINLTCELLGKATKDNGFLVGTYFSGKLTEENGVTRLKGIITTAPIYHAGLIALLGVFIYQCFYIGGFSVIPPILLVFDYFLFKEEFRKQGYIKRYLYRAARKIREEKK